MSTSTLDLESRFRRITGRESRSQSIATRFTRAEANALAKRAEAKPRQIKVNVESTPEAKSPKVA